MRRGLRLLRRLKARPPPSAPAGQQAERFFLARSARILAFSPPFLEGCEWRLEASAHQVFPASRLLHEAAPPPSTPGEGNLPAAVSPSLESLPPPLAQEEAALPGQEAAPPGAELPIPLLGQALAALVQDEGWHQGSTVLVLPTSLLRVRTLKLPAVKPAQAARMLPFALAEKSLDDVEEYLLRFSLRLQEEGGGAHAMVFMQPKAQLQPTVRTLEQCGFGVQRTTTSLHVLEQLWPALRPGIHFQVYAGGDEVFVCTIAAQRLRQVQSVSSQVGAVLAQALLPAACSPQPLWEWLSAPQEQGPCPLAAGWTAQRLSRELCQALEQAVAALNRYIVSEASSAEPCEVHFHGMFAPCLAWNATAFRVEVDWKPQALVQAAQPYWGILSVLPPKRRAAMEAARRSLSFYRSPTPWRGWLRGHPLKLAAVLLLGGLWIWLEVQGSSLERAAQAQQQSRLRAQVVSQLGLAQTATPQQIQAALSQRRNGVEALRDEKARLERFLKYNYTMVRLLMEISKIVSGRQGMHVQSLSIGKAQLQIHGLAAGFEDAEVLKNQLLNLPVLQGGTGTVNQSRRGTQVNYRVRVLRPQ